MCQFSDHATSNFSADAAGNMRKKDCFYQALLRIAQALFPAYP